MSGAPAPAPFVPAAPRGLGAATTLGAPGVTSPSAASGPSSDPVSAVTAAPAPATGESGGASGAAATATATAAAAAAEEAAPSSGAPSSAAAKAPLAPLVRPPSADRRTSGGTSSGGSKSKGDNLLVKIGMVGDPGVGKTSLMVKYVEGKFDEDYVETLGVNFLEKTINLPTAQVIMSLWDLGGAKEFVSMMPMVCVDAVAVLFLFDLTNRATLTSVREWFRQVRGLNTNATPFLVGTKYDLFYSFDPAKQEEITKQARKFAAAMKAPLIFCSSSHTINVQKLFKIIFSKVFDVKCSVARKSAIGDPLIEY